MNNTVTDVKLYSKHIFLSLLGYPGIISSADHSESLPLKPL